MADSVIKDTQEALAGPLSVLHGSVCVSVSVCVFDGHCAAQTAHSSFCKLAALILFLSYLNPGKVNEVLALLQEVKMG